MEWMEETAQEMAKKNSYVWDMYNKQGTCL